MTVKIKTNETLLFVGDSITDCGRRGASMPLGSGYVKVFTDLMINREPEKKVNIINKGISGNTVRDLQNRWTDDVMRHNPDWLSIKIGINDLHQALRGVENAITPAVFTEIYDEILSRTTKKFPACKIILIQPFYISLDKTSCSFRSEVLKVLPGYLKAVEKMRKKYNTRIVKTHEIFQKLLKYYEPDTFCPEPVHPNPTGHLVIAEAIYNILSK